MQKCNLNEVCLFTAVSYRIEKSMWLVPWFVPVMDDGSASIEMKYKKCTSMGAFETGMISDTVLYSVTW